MIVVIPVVVVLTGLLLWALYAEEVAAEPAPVLRPWNGIPTTADITRTDFPLAPVGYDRAAVEQHLARVAAAMDALQCAHAHITPDPDDPAAGPPPALVDAPGTQDDAMPPPDADAQVGQTPPPPPGH